MSLINPSINISIGNYGDKYITSCHNYFTKNEHEINNYTSFYKCGFNNDGIFFNSINGTTNCQKLKIDENTSRLDLLNQLSEKGNVYFLKNSISNAYYNLINLDNQLASSVNFQLVNVNLILSSFEENSTLLLYCLIEQINYLSESRALNHLSVKVFTIISKNQDLLNLEEQVIAYQSFEEIRTIQSRFNIILHNVIFIDNLNTNSIFLRLNEESIGFVLCEFITYLMTNHYKMIGNLLNAEILAMGLGTLIFDKDYFSVFFQNRILNQIVLDEQIDGEGIQIFKTSEYVNLRDTTLIPFLKGEIDFKNLLNKINKSLNTFENNFTLLEYDFLLANLLGKHDSIPIDPNFTNIERISLYDILFKILNDLYAFLGNKHVNIFDLKRRLDEEVELTKKITRLLLEEEGKIQGIINQLDGELAAIQSTINSNSEKGFLDANLLQEKSNINHKIKALKIKILQSNYDNEQLSFLKRKLFEIQILKSEQTQIVEDTLSKFKGKRIKPEIENLIKPKISRNVDELHVKRKKIVGARESFFARIFKSSLKSELISIDTNISESMAKLNRIDEKYSEAIEISTPLFELVEDLEELHKLLKSSIERIKNKRFELNKQFYNAKLKEYFFINHVIDQQKLEDFYKKNQNDFKAVYSSLLNKIRKINDDETDFLSKEIEFSQHLDSLLEDKVNSIIQFNIIEYINGNYNQLDLFKQQSINVIIDELLKMATPFFNADNSFNSNNSHLMMLHNKNVKEMSEIDNLHNSLRSCFPSSIPQQIDTLNINKFSIIKIDVIRDFKNIVKYNECEKAYKISNSDTIIIN